MTCLKSDELISAKKPIGWFECLFINFPVNSAYRRSVALENVPIYI